MDLAEKLDLHEYLQAFRAFMARPKEVSLQGDVLVHYRYLKALEEAQIPKAPELGSFDAFFVRLQKQGVLHLDESFEIIKLIAYLQRLKATLFQEPVASWVAELTIPETLTALVREFTDEGSINPAYDETLADIERALKKTRESIRESLYALTRSSKLSEFLVDSQVHLHENEQALLLRGGFGRVLKGSVVGRTTAGYFYVVPQSVRSLKERESQLLSEREAILWQHTKRISEELRKQLRFLRFADAFFDRFDHYRARILFAKSKGYLFVPPDTQKRIVLHGFAHPALSDPKPIDIRFEKEVMLITGVNAGGKTMLLKSLLAAAYMSTHLLPMRCDATKTKIGHFKRIEAIIDDPQSVKNDISTFAGRMRAFAELFKQKEALVGVDEIELGTDSDEAASLFRVLLQRLRKRGMRFVVTTHHKRLASLMASESETELVAALYDEQNRVPTYRFLQGSIGKSYAFETALRYGIPETVVDEAKRVHGEDKERLNELIERSSELERTMRAKIAENEAAQAKLNAKIKALQEEEERLRQKHAKALATLENRYNAALKRAQAALKAKESKEGRRLLNEAHRHKSMAPRRIEASAKPEPLKVGDRVKYRSHKGELLAIKGKEAAIEVEGLKMRVPLADLKRLSTATTTPKASKAKQPATTVHVEKSGASVSVKLLGLYAEEAEEKLDKFLSDAMVNGLSEVEVIHGTGKGILAKVVERYLREHPKIKSFYRPAANQGVTIVEL